MALLTPRWRAYDTMELARRLEMDVKHVHLDPRRTPRGHGALSLPRAERGWVGPLGAGVVGTPWGRAVHRSAARGDLRGRAQRRCNPGAGSRYDRRAGARRGGSSSPEMPEPIAAWPRSLWLRRTRLTAQAARGIPLGSSSTAWYERGRLSDKPPFQAYRFGNGACDRLHRPFRFYPPRPLNSAIEGLDGATDRSSPGTHAPCSWRLATCPRAQVALRGAAVRPPRARRSRSRAGEGRGRC